MSKIKTFKEFIKESVWGDIYKRGAGEQVRKEDDVNLLDREGFYEYMEEHYGKKIKDIDVRVDNYWGEGWNVHTHIKQANLCIDSFYDKNENITRLRIYPYGDEKTTLADIEPPALKKRFKVTHSEYLNYADNITEKDDTCTNQTYVDLVELILDHFSLKVNESVWGDIYKRGAGEQTRQEDDINLLDENDFEKYLQDHYNVTNGYCIYHLGGITVPVLKSSFANENTFALIYDGMYQDGIYISDDLQDYYPQLYKELQKEFVLSHRGSMFNITPKSGEKCTNKFCIEVLDFIIDHTKKDLIIEKR